MAPLIDPFARPITYLRVSVTDRCDFRCTYCMAEHMQFLPKKDLLTLEELDRLASAFVRLGVEKLRITGGEPLLQKGAPVLARRLLDLGYTVLCETSGERDIDLMPPGVRRIMDLKPPGSGEAHRMRWENIAQLRPGDEVKFVITDRADFEWMLDVIRRYDLLSRAHVLVSPAYTQLPPAELAAWILACGLDLRLNLQMHKTLWGEERGR